MARDFTQAVDGTENLIDPTGAFLRNAIDIPDSYYMLMRAEVAPSRIYFNAWTSSHAISDISDPIGIVDDPLRQEIIYASSIDRLVTFFVDGTTLKCVLSGSSNELSLGLTTSAKPGALGDKLFVVIGGDVNRYDIDWDTMTPGAVEATLTPATALPVYAVHAVSETEAVLVAYDDGGYRSIIMNGTTKIEAPVRFMFPHRIDLPTPAEGEPAKRDLTAYSDLAQFSGAARLGNKTYCFMSNASMGNVEAVYYDYDTNTWSDIYVALPAELEVSQCEFRIANVYEHNGTIYMAGQFIRTDAYEGQNPYTLILYTEDGKTFSIDRFTLVGGGNIGYRCLATVGGDSPVSLYISSCNRIASSAVTWVFDGKNGTDYIHTHLSESQILSASDSNLNQLNLSVISGKEEFFNSAYLIETARLKLYTGMKTIDMTNPSVPVEHNEYVLYGTYIIDDADYGIDLGSRDCKVTCINESQWRLSGLSMPFYAEFFGKSAEFDPMTEESGKLYTAPGGTITTTSFSIDFWKQEPYVYSGGGLTIEGMDMIVEGGVDYKETTAAHHLGIITKDEIADLLSLGSNPKITANTLNIKVYGWSHALTGSENDDIHLIVRVEDEDGNEKPDLITLEHTNRWINTYPSTGTGTDPIVFQLTNTNPGGTHPDGWVIGDRIKKVGISFHNATAGTWFCPARVDFIDGVEVALIWSDSNTPWEKQDDGTFKVPSTGRAFIMFAEKPYNSWNFNQSAVFANSITGGIAGFPTACGLVGHAEDASNYIVGRYNRTTSKAEIIVCRNGIETELANGTPGFTAIDDPDGDCNIGVQFIHKDGTYTINMWNFDTASFEFVVSYDWKATDGFQYTSRVVAMRCGIYGNIATPWVRILGYYAGSTENLTNADGIPVHPLDDITSFPAAGTLRIRENKYTYNSKIAHPTMCRGPYQFRNMGVYAPPLDASRSGLECRDFDYTANIELVTGYLIAIDSGANFLCNGALWQCFTFDGPTRRDLNNRARFYSINTQIGQLYHTLMNKVWIVGGFLGITNTSPTKSRHSENELAFLDLPGEIKCYWYQGAGGADDTTVADLIRIVSNLCGADANFPGDFTQTTLSISGETDITTCEFSEGFDFRYEFDAPTDHEIRTNVVITPDNYEIEGYIDEDTGLKIVMSSLGAGAFQFWVISTPSATPIYSMKYTLPNATIKQKYRILFHEDFVSLYHNDIWIATVAFDGLEYDEINGTTVKMYTSTPHTIGNVIVRELADWREAVYIDLETDGRSALGSIIQERPIEAVSNPDGTMDYWYAFTRDEITAVRAPINHRYHHAVPTEGASDAIIQGVEDVKTYQNADFAEALGFSTKLMRLPNLTVGALHAAVIMMRKTYESRHTHELTIRPDLALIVGDVYKINYTPWGSVNTQIADVIIESIQFTFQMVGSNIDSSMVVRGREKVTY